MKTTADQRPRDRKLHCLASTGDTGQRSTVDEAIEWGRLRCYLAPDADDKVRSDLEKKDAATWSYGFTSIHIERKNQ